MTHKFRWLCFVLLIGVTISPITQSANQLTTTQKKLVHVNQKIQKTQHQLLTDQKQKNQLESQLSLTEKKISQIITQKETLVKKINQNNRAIVELSSHVKQLDQQIKNEQKILARHLKCRYQIDAHQPLKWLLFPGDKTELSQVLTYYRYLIKAQQTSINHIKQHTIDLNHQKKSLHRKLDLDKKMQQSLGHKRRQLEETQLTQKSILTRLSRSITSKSQQLKDFQRNQQQLTSLLSKLTKQHRIEQSRPFASRRHHLPRPVHVNTHAIKPVQQGLAFYAAAGTNVAAIHSGKVVFSDWLKGYGLLLILDHGHGYMTLYAHNQALLKRKGDWVEGGEKIAKVGHSGGLRENGLYFEIRHKGKAISPVNWLS